MNLLRIDDQVREVILADHITGQRVTVIAPSGSGQGVIEDEGGGLGIGQQLAVAQGRGDDGMHFEARVRAVGQTAGQ
ncbi:hypothetical protein D3C72_2204710 [compost metagenome]